MEEIFIHANILDAPFYYLFKEYVYLLNNYFFNI